MDFRDLGIMLRQKKRKGETKKEGRAKSDTIQSSTTGDKAGTRSNHIEIQQSMTAGDSGRKVQTLVLQRLALASVHYRSAYWVWKPPPCKESSTSHAKTLSHLVDDSGNLLSQKLSAYHGRT